MNIKEELVKILSEKFPSIKFNIRINKSKLETSVDVVWTNGPCDDLVSELFQGLEKIDPKDYTKPDYIFAKRMISSDVLDSMIGIQKSKDSSLDDYELERISKSVLHNLYIPISDNEISIVEKLDNIYEFIISDKKTNDSNSKAEQNNEIKEFVKKEEEVSLSLEKYSDNSFVVRGRKTFDIKPFLMENGGKYNKFLKGGPGWIFSNKKYDIVQEYINNL